MPTFVVGGLANALQDHDFVILRAISKEDALNRYANEIGNHYETFLKFVYEKAVNLSFAEQFWFYNENETPVCFSWDDLATDQVFIQRVKLFFSEHTQWAEIYLEAYFCGSRYEPMSHFPKNMLAFIFAETWLNDMVAVEVELPTPEREFGLPVGPNPDSILRERLAELRYSRFAKASFNAPAK